MVKTFYYLDENKYSFCGWVTPSAVNESQAESLRNELLSNGVDVKDFNFNEPSIFINLSSFPSLNNEGYSESFLIDDVCETIYHEFVHHMIRKNMGRVEYMNFANEQCFFNEFITYYMTSEGKAFEGFLKYNRFNYLKYLCSPFNLVRRFFLLGRSVFSKVFNFLGFIGL